MQRYLTHGVNKPIIFAFDFCKVLSTVVVVIGIRNMASSDSEGGTNDAEKSPTKGKLAKDEVAEDVSK